jgi:hypothetical protein
VTGATARTGGAARPFVAGDSTEGRGSLGGGPRAGIRRNPIPCAASRFRIATGHRIERDGSDGDVGVTEPVSAWQCIGCGRIEAPQTCIGVCQDRRVEFVYASHLREAEAALEATRTELDRLHALVHRLAFSRPREGEWERSYRALQAQARDALRAGEGVPEHAA